MKLQELRQLIREEISKAMNESNPVEDLFKKSIIHLIKNQPDFIDNILSKITDEDLVKDSFTHLVKNQPDFIANMLSKITGGTMDDKMVKRYWNIMVDGQPDDVVNMLVKLNNGELTYEDFSSSTEEDIYDSFRDEFNEDDDF